MMSESKDDIEWSEAVPVDNLKDEY